jgi:hypothetical protein
LNVIRNSAAIMRVILSASGHPVKSISHTDIKDLIGFVIRHVQNKTLTLNFCKEHAKELSCAFDMYLIYKKYGPDSENLTRNLNKRATIQHKHDIFDALLVDPETLYNYLMYYTTETGKKDLVEILEMDRPWVYTLDMGKKNKKLNDREKFIADLLCNWRDPITGDRITEENMEYHHVSPNSCNSDSKIRVVTRDTNKKLGGISIEYLEKQRLVTNV